MNGAWGEGASWGLLFLRLTVGLIFIAHGFPKFSGRGGGNPKVGREHFAGTLQRLGVPLPFYAAVLIGGIEFFGGLLLIAGLWTRWTALVLVPVMVVASVKNFFEKGFVAGVDFPLSVLAALVALFFLGGGSLGLGEWFWGR